LKLKIRHNPDEKLANEIKQSIKDNGGYCPCELTKTTDTLCMCKAFREQNTEGYCHCQLYHKIKAE